MTRVLLWTAAVLLGLAPLGLGVGVGLAVANLGVGIAAGSLGYGVAAAFALTADLVPDPEREVTR